MNGAIKLFLFEMKGVERNEKKKERKKRKEKKRRED